MQRASLLSLALVALSALASPASALDCGQRLVVVGDPSVYVRSICGEPAAISTRTESRTSFAYGRSASGVVGSGVTVTVEIQTWLYDFGRRRFMEELTFESGVLRSIRTLGYGTSTGVRRGALLRPRGSAIAERVAIRPRRAA